MDTLFQRAVFIGTGLIGGSAALAAKSAGIVGTVVGVARTEATRSRALADGVADEATSDARAAVEGADLVYLAVPLGSVEAVLQSIAPALSRECLVTDAESVKGSVVRAAEGALPHPEMFVGGHPMAGSEKAGVQYAQADLYQGRAYFLTPTEATSSDALDGAKALVEALGAKLLLASPAEHDDIVASVSHLPHVAAAALMGLVARHGAAEGMRLGASGGGFRDMTRIAASPGAMWREILAANREQVLSWLEMYRSELGQIADTIRRGDWMALEELLEEAAQARRTLD